MIQKAGLPLLIAAVLTAGGARAQSAEYSLEEASRLLDKYCLNCHQPKTAIGGLDVTKFRTRESFREEPGRWTSMAGRVHNGEMPPRGTPGPELEERERFAEWVRSTLRAEACAAGLQPGPAPIRRLNRAEYSATIRDLLNIHLDVGASLPADGGGGEGFDNAAETLFLSPIHAEKYLDAAKLALATVMGDSKIKAQLFIARPGAGVTPEQAAREVLGALLPRAFRRPTTDAELAPFLDLFRSALKKGRSFEESVVFAARAILISPDFLFRSEPPNAGPEPRLLDDYAMASRLSYFLWGSMPDSLLFDLAARGKLQDPEVLEWQIGRMLRNPKSLDFATRFVEQWLGTRKLGKSFLPDAELFPEYFEDVQIRSDIGYQPIMFFRELLMRDDSLLNLIDSKFTVVTRTLQKHYGLEGPRVREMLERVPLPEGSDRGGLLGMAAVLAVSSHPHRTSPVLRGVWLLDAILGTPPPPAPPDVPPLKEEQGATPQSLRERLEQHRANPVCGSCHSRIDPLGFALENYDVLGRWRGEEAGQPIDARGELPDGTAFEGPRQLKAVLLDRKELFIRNLTTKMLGYALGRGLTLEDACTVDAIVSELEKKDYSAQALIREIVFSMPFRYQAGAASQSPNSVKKRTE